LYGIFNAEIQGIRNDGMTDGNLIEMHETVFEEFQILQIQVMTGINA